MARRRATELALRQAVTERTHIMTRRSLVFLMLLLAGAGNSGCAAVGLTLFGVGAGLSANTGTSYTLGSVSYKTFAASEEGLHTATLKTLKRMDIAVTEDQSTESGRAIVGAAEDRTIEIEIDRLTKRTSRMRVVVKRPWLFRDRSTAEEIVSQTEQTLQAGPALGRKATLAATGTGGKPEEVSLAAEPPAKGTWEKIKDGASAMGSSVRDSFAKFFGD